VALTAPERDLSAETEEQRASALEDYFEQLSATAPEGWRVELIEGSIHVVPPANGQHEEFVSEFVHQVTIHGDDSSLRLYTGIGLRLPGPIPADRVIPDVVVAPKGSFATSEEWHDPSPVVLVAEVTSTSTGANDRGMKLRAYARAGVPHYFLVDRKAWTVTLYAEPSDGGYRSQRTTPISEKIMLPKPFEFELDTSEF
jgi:Uma2 family endonuclease